MYKIKYKDGSVKEFDSLAGADLCGADLPGADLRGDWADMDQPGGEECIGKRP